MADPVFASPAAHAAPPAPGGTGLGSGGRPMTEAEIVRVAREFESVFLGQAVQQMFETVEMGEMGGGHAEEQWRGFLATAMADRIAEQGTTGIAERVADSLRERIVADRAEGQGA